MQFQYIGPRIRGASTTFQQWSITPAQSNMSFNTNDVIKFMGNISQGLYDPYRSHFDITVQVQNEVGLIQLDNGAHSMINQMILLSRQTQIERIQQYDVLGSMLCDLGFSEVMCQNKTGEGIGYTNIPTNIASSCVRPQPSKTAYKMPQDTTSYVMQYANFGGYNPTMAPNSSFNYWAYANINQPSTIAAQSNILAQNLGSGLRSYSNYLTYPYNPAVNNSYISQTGRALNVRCQHILGPLTNGYPNAPWSIPPTGISVANQKWNYTNMLSVGYTPGNKYATSYQLATPNISQTPQILGNNMPASCSQVGYGKPFASSFCTGANQPFLSAVVPQAQMRNGVILPQPIAVTTKTFRMPFISGILGITIPPDQFQLIPVASMKDVTLQLSLNPYAFFTSGYSDVHQFDTNGMQIANMQKRYWRYTSFNWIWHLYTFNKEEIIVDIKTKLYNGISISSNYWQLTSSYQLPHGAYVRNSFGIPVNVQSLAQILICFLSNQYTTKSFCRKQFRLSNNISSLQFKANGFYYPLQPIQGNAGNPEQIDTTGDNWNFYQLLLLSNNHLFNTNVPLPRINQRNFAINGRIYDTSDTRTLMPVSLYNATKPDFNQTYNSLNQAPWKQINGNTAMGMSWFHQNRYIGKAIYAWSFEPYGHSKGMINGLNTTNYRQFDVTINTIPENEFPFDQTMCIFTRSNVIVRYFDGYIQVLGA